MMTMRSTCRACLPSRRRRAIRTAAASMPCTTATSTPSPEERIRRARRGYYGMISYIDAQLGRILAALEALGRRDDTVIIATADHGDMLGERGLWYKMTFFERAVRVPLDPLCAGAVGGATRGAERVAGRSAADPAEHRRKERARCNACTDRWLQLDAVGRGGTGGPDAVYGEYMAEGTSQPIFMIRRDNLQTHRVRRRSAAAVRFGSRSARAEQSRGARGAGGDRGRLRRRGRAQMGQRGDPPAGHRQPAPAHADSWRAVAGTRAAVGLCTCGGPVAAVLP